MMFSIVATPCGPPNPRNAVFGGLFVRQTVRHHGGRQIGECAAVGVEIDFEANDLAGRLESDAIAISERVALPRHVHVHVFVVRDARRPARPPCDESRHRGWMRRLRFLPSEGAAHAFRVHHDLIHVDPEEVRDHFLDLGRVLRRGVHRQCVVLTRMNERCLRFEIEVILSAVLEDPFQHVLRRGNRGFPVATTDVTRVLDEARCGHGGRRA